MQKSCILGGQNEHLCVNTCMHALVTRHTGELSNLMHPITSLYRVTLFEILLVSIVIVNINAHTV